MKIFLAGATGAVGKRLVPLLVAHGHDVAGTTRSPAKAEDLRAAGAQPVVLDVLDSAAVMAAVGRAAPDVVIHQSTALAGFTGNPRRFAKEFAPTSRLRSEGTDNLLAAARAAGVHRFVAQSYAGWFYAPRGGQVITEDDPPDPDPPEDIRPMLAAIRHLETAVTTAEDMDGLVLRYGGFYGPGTSISPGGVHAELVRRRRFPIIGSGSGVWSFAHIDDVASATLAAVEGPTSHSGVYNIVDDDPAPVSEWLPVLAATLGAKPPRHLPPGSAALSAATLPS
jgi:nucleoside-diphosphate-sugar epimerase